MKSSKIGVWTSIAIAIGGVACSTASGTGDPSGTSSADDKTGYPRSDAGTQPVTPAPVVQSLVETPIVTNQTDPNLINAWGLAFNPSGAAWVNENGTGHSAVYGSTGGPSRLVVTIPAPAGATGPSKPTGAMFNEDAADFLADKFIFVTENGTIAGWQSGNDAVTRVDNSSRGAIYTGLATINSTAVQAGRLFAANFHAGTVDAFDANYRSISCSGGFADRNMPSGYAPFNIVATERGGLVLVSYALQNSTKTFDVAGVGNGFVDLFDLDGNLVTRLISQGVLNAPWGMAFAPHGFGDVADTLLVGNFGDGHINSYLISRSNKSDDKTMAAQLLGGIGDETGKPIALDGLWALTFGVDAGGFSSNTLYFTSGPAMETQGIFGMLALP